MNTKRTDAHDQQMDDLHHIAEGIKRIEQLFEMRCEDHAELMRYAFDVVNFPSNERVRALKAVVEQQKAKWRGLGERDPETKELRTGLAPVEPGHPHFDKIIANMDGYYAPSEVSQAKAAKRAWIEQLGKQNRKRGYVPDENGDVPHRGHFR